MNETLTHIANLLFNLPAHAVKELSPPCEKVKGEEGVDHLPSHIKDTVYEVSVSLLGHSPAKSPYLAVTPRKFSIPYGPL